MPPDASRVIRVIDTHYGGDVSRIVIGGVPDPPGATVLDKMRALARDYDGLRRLLLYPPHGDPSMCVDLVVRPSHPEAQAGYVIMEAMGYPPFSGSNTICTVTALLESGRLPMREGPTEVRLESPAGLVAARADCQAGRVVCVTVEGGPAFVAATDRTVDVPGRGEVRFDLIWSGCFYAVVDAASVGLAVTADAIPELTRLAHGLVEAARAGADLALTHPDLGEVGPLSFVCFAGPVARDGADLRSPSATYVHPGVLCSCPTGTGTSARLALLRHHGRIDPGQGLITVSPRGSTMTGTFVDDTRVGDHPAIRSTISGRAFTLARSDVVIDPDDPAIGDHGLLRLLAGAT